jgi:phosphatidylserine decarboxylase
VRPAGAGWRLGLAALARLPQGAISRGAGWFADIPLPRALRRSVLGGFARAVGIDLAEAAHPLEAYPSLNHFFVRRLRPGLRPWPGDGGVVGSPVDGVVAERGGIRDGELVQAKGLVYSAAELLGSEEDALPYQGGGFLTIYLSPRHYHRIHAPVGGRIVSARHIPGALMPVNGPAVAGVPRLFATNERLVVHIEGPGGRVALVAVGATNVGAISTRFDASWGGPCGKTPASAHITPAEAEVRSAHPPRPVTNRRRPLPPVRTYEPAIEVAGGEEILAFHLGSTIVLLTEREGYAWDESIPAGTDVRLGTPMGRAITRPDPT